MNLEGSAWQLAMKLPLNAKVNDLWVLDSEVRHIQKGSDVDGCKTWRS